MVDRDLVLSIAQHHSSFYLYQEAILQRQALALTKELPDVSLLYSLKANPHPRILDTLFALGFGADAASCQEVQISQRKGLSKEHILYSAPGKTMEDLAQTLESSTLVADSILEVQRIEQLAKNRGIVVPIGIRINPDFGFDVDTGVPSKFGIDQDQVFAHMPLFQQMKHIQIVGIHVHLRSQELQAHALQTYHNRVFQLAGQVQQALGKELAFVNLGSGLGIPYEQDDPPLDVQPVAQSLCQQVQAFHSHSPRTQFFLETGRFVVGESGLYCTTVVDKKISHGKTFVILDKTLQGFIRPSLAQLVRKYDQGPSPAPCEPLFTTANPCQILALTNETQRETVTLVGNLCTAADVIAQDISLPKLSCGDVLVLTNAGSYGAVLSPMQFSSHTPPAQLYLTNQGDIL